jgi:hypothetical protein
MLFNRFPTTLVSYLLSGLGVGGLTLGVGQLLPHSPESVPATFSVTECAGIPAEGQRTSTLEVHLVEIPQAGTDAGASVEVDFLNEDADIVRSNHADLLRGGEIALQLPTRLAGIALQVVASSPVLVEVTLNYDGSVGAVERRPLPCEHIALAVRHGGP